jgi:hypothetical protein
VTTPNGTSLPFRHLCSTARYTQVATNLIAGTSGPFDRFSLTVILPD